MLYFIFTAAISTHNVVMLDARDLVSQMSI